MLNLNYVLMKCLMVSLMPPGTKSGAAAPLPEVPVIRDPSVVPIAGHSNTSALVVPPARRNDLAEADDLALFCRPDAPLFTFQSRFYFTNLVQPPKRPWPLAALLGHA